MQIDGAKVRQLREQQGLTQLYIATAVDVTTDTVSRWENNRYPTIKKENGEKLAEALGVTLKDILLPESRDNSEDQGNTPSNFQKITGSESKNRRYLLFFFTLFIIMALICIVAFFLLPGSPPTITAVRKLPVSTLPGHPFPVVIEVHTYQKRDVSIILKEKLPDGCTLLSATPQNGPLKNQELKWLHKITGVRRFSYLARIDTPQQENIIFHGVVSTSKNRRQMAVNGADTIQIGNFHWADSDRDNRISDQEILAVFDYYSSIDNFTIDLSFIEKMWLGSSYNWDSVSRRIDINP